MGWYVGSIGPFASEVDAWRWSLPDKYAIQPSNKPVREEMEKTPDDLEHRIKEATHHFAEEHMHQFEQMPRAILHWWDRFLMKIGITKDDDTH